MFRRSAWALSAILVVLGTIGSFGVLGAGAAPSQAASGQFTAVAAADAYRATVEIPSFLIIEKLVDGGGPRAQATVDSGGTSIGFAALPDPGETVVALPGLVSIITGVAFPVGYPLYVNTQYPTLNEDAIDQPGYHLAAKSDAKTAAASSQLGERTPGIEGSSFATAEVTQTDDGTVVSHAEAAIASLNIGALEIAGFRSEATVTREANGEPKRETSTTVGRITVAGIPLTIDEHGLSLAGSPLGALPLPLAEVLEGAGIDFEYLPAIEDPDGVVAAGIRITTSFPVPNIGTDANVEIVLGRASASAGTTSFGFDDESSGPIVEPAVDLPAFGDAAGADIASLDAPAAGAPPAAEPAAGSSASVIRGAAMRLPAGNFYPILILSGLLLGGMTKAFPTTRSIRWSS